MTFSLNFHPWYLKGFFFSLTQSQGVDNTTLSACFPYCFLRATISQSFSTDLHCPGTLGTHSNSHVYRVPICGLLRGLNAFVIITVTWLLIRVYAQCKFCRAMYGHLVKTLWSFLNCRYRDHCGFCSQLSVYGVLVTSNGFQVTSS